MRSKVALTILWLFCLIATMPVGPAPRAASALPLEELVREVKIALLGVEQAAEADNLPSLDRVELEVNTIQTVGGDGRIALLVVELGGDATQEFTNTVKLILVPPPVTSSSDVSETNLADALVGSILAGARAIAAAKKGAPPLFAKELAVTIKFGLSREAGGKLAVKFPPFEIGGGGKLTSSEVSKIIVTYRVSSK